MGSIMQSMHITLCAYLESWWVIIPIDFSPGERQEHEFVFLFSITFNPMNDEIFEKSTSPFLKVTIKNADVLGMLE